MVSNVINVLIAVYYDTYTLYISARECANMHIVVVMNIVILHR